MRRRDGHGNRAGQGRPPAPYPGFYQTIGGDHDGDFITPRVRVWVEGEAIVNDIDDEGKLVKDKLAAFLRELSNRRDETGTPFPGSTLTLKQQAIATEGSANRRYAARIDRRIKLAELARYIDSYPGETAERMIEYFYQGECDPKRAAETIRVALHRLTKASGIVRKYDEHGVPHYWPPGDVNAVGRPADARVRAIAASIAFIQDGAVKVGETQKYYAAARALAELIDHNRDRPADAWRSPPRDGEEKPF